MASDRIGLIKVTYVKSSIGYNQRQKDTVRSLGLRRLGDSVVHADSPPIRGMVNAVQHLVTAEPIDPADVVLESGA
mgnify:CR=1 FL=1